MLKKIEGILVALGYDGCDIKDVKVTDLNDQITISFAANKPKVKPKKEEMDSVPASEVKKAIEERKKSIIEEVKESNQATLRSIAVPKTTYISKVASVNAEKSSEPVKDSTDEKKKRDMSDYKKSTARYNWKSTVPRAVVRYVFFKTFQKAEDFQEQYKGEFELIKDQRTTKNPTAYRITKNKSDKYLADMGYNYMLEFHMNGAAFEVLENVEHLKKKPTSGSHRGAACIRYKE